MKHYPYDQVVDRIGRGSWGMEHDSMDEAMRTMLKHPDLMTFYAVLRIAKNLEHPFLEARNLWSVINVIRKNIAELTEQACNDQHPVADGALAAIQRSTLPFLQLGDKATEQLLIGLSPRARRALRNELNGKCMPTANVTMKWLLRLHGVGESTANEIYTAINGTPHG